MLTAAHRQYLQQRYGTVELDPIPDMHDEDPLNWGKGKVGLSQSSRKVDM